MLKRLAFINSSTLKSFYKKLNVDVERFLIGLEGFELLEDPLGLRRWHPPVHGDGKFYEDLSRHPWYYLKEKEEFSFARKLIGNARVLEVGCGSGYFADGSCFDSYIGLEMNADAACNARQKGHRVQEMMLHEYAILNPASVDVVCSFQVLEHLSDPSSYFEAAFTVLTPTGILITSVPAEDSFVGSSFYNCLNAPPHHLTRWTDNALTKFPTQFGFECIELYHIPVEPVHYRWFWRSLLEEGFLTEGSMIHSPTTRVSLRLKRKIAELFLSLMGFCFSVPRHFFIPGHTVLSVHRKSSSCIL